MEVRNDGPSNPPPLVAALLVLAGCDPERPTPVTPDDATVDLAPGAGVTWRDVMVPPHSIDALFLEVNREVPGFAGMVIEDGRPTIFTTDPDALDAARRSLGPLLETRQLAAVEPNRRAADYEWVELAVWRAGLRTVLRHDDVVWLDTNEALNRVDIGVLSGFDEARLTDDLATRGVPRDAVVFTVTEPTESLNDLTDRVRPATGGLRVNDDPFEHCSLGVNVAVGNARMFLTASHCTDALAQLTGTSFYQSTLNHSGHFIGTEVTDPSGFTTQHPDCDDAYVSPPPSPDDRCRWSDVARIAYEDSVASTHGEVAQTASADRWNGSTTIVGAFEITGKEYTVVVGDTVHKVGATTGWTYGDVDQTCADRRHPDNSNVIMVCDHGVNAGAYFGDSGSAVFTRLSGVDIELAGILWGGEPPDTVSGARFIFSSIGDIEFDFGAAMDVLPADPLSPSIVGPLEVPPQSNCTWQAFAGGGLSPWSYTWSGALSGSGVGTGTTNWISGTLSESDWLKVSVGSGDGQQGADSVFVVVTSQADPCPESP